MLLDGIELQGRRRRRRQERLPRICQRESLLRLMRNACGQVELPDGDRPRLDLMGSPMDYLRLLKENPVRASNT